MKWPFYSKPNRFKEIFVGYLRTNWSLKFNGVTGYINAIGYLLDFHKSYSDLKKIHKSVFNPPEIYIQRHLSKNNEIRLERGFECLLSEPYELPG